MSVYLDAHAHWYPVFDPATFLASAHAAIASARAKGGQTGTGVLMIADPEPVDTLAALRQPPAPWRTTLDVEGALVLERDSQPLVLIAGRQLITAERLELLCLASTAQLDNRRPAEDLIRACRDAGGIPVLPWGFGKWWGDRGRKVRSLITGDAPPAFLGDSRTRRGGRDAADLFRLADESGIPTLCGTDPLPLPSEQAVAGSFGSVVGGNLDLADPAESVRQMLLGLRRSPPIFGIRAGLVEFARGQIGLRLGRGNSPASRAAH